MRNSKKNAENRCVPKKEIPMRYHPLPSKGWAEMIRKVYEVDPLLCPTCGGLMRVIAFITDYSAVDRIITHLKFTFHAERPPPPRVLQQELLMGAEERREYF